MKVVRPTLRILLDDLDKLDKAKENLKHCANAWMNELDNRDGGWSSDQYYISILRNNLENSVIEYRKKLAEVYDFMGDKGLV